MTKRSLLLSQWLVLAIVLALVTLAQPLSADVLEWSSDDWKIDCETQIPYLTFDNLVWQVGQSSLQLTGPSPSVVDPDINELTENNTPVIWTDWHVSIQNGTIVDAQVEKVSGPAWVVIINPDGSGFEAHTALQNGKINVGEQLNIWFRYNVTGSGDVIIDEYPTTTYVPEASSLMALTTALTALGIGKFRSRQTITK